MHNCGFVETNKKGLLSLAVLLHCSFHNVNHNKFQSSGKEKTNNSSVNYLIGFFLFEDLDENGVCDIFPTLHLRCLMKSLTHSIDT